MTGRRKKAQRTLAAERPRESAAPASPRRSLRGRWIAAFLLVAASALFVQRQIAARSREPVAPRDASQLDPDVRQTIEEHLANARSDPSAQNHGTLGLVYEANGLWDEAARCFDIALDLSPSEPLWRLHKGIVASDQGDLDAALALFEEVVRERGDLAAARFRLADALQRAGRTAPALEHYREAARLAPDRSEAHAGLGAALLEQGELDAARTSLERAVELDPAYKSAHYQLGLVLRALGDREGAARELALGVDATKRFVPDPMEERMKTLRVGYSARLQGAVDLVRSGRQAEGIAILEKLRSQHPTDTNVLNNLAAAYMDDDRPKHALPLLEKARSLSESEFPTWINLASWALESQRFEEALTYAERAVALAENVGATHAARGKALYCLRRQDEAYAALAKAVQLDPRDPKVLMLFGITCIELKHYDEARTSLTRAIALAPDWVEPRINLCKLQAALGELEHARETLDVAQRIAPEHPAVLELARSLAAR